jgi:Acetyl-CoA hydrolase
MTVSFHRPTVDSILTSAQEIYVSACATEIGDAPDLLRKSSPRGGIVTGIFSPLINRRSYADAEIGLRTRSFFLSKELKNDLALGLVDYLPWRYNMIDRWLSQPGRFDTAMVMVSPPDHLGNCSLGVQTDFLPSFIKNVERLIGFVNPNIPRTLGDGDVPYSSFAAIVDYDLPLKTLQQKGPDAAAIRISEAIAELVEDNSTVQFGIGQIPSQVIARLTNHRGLRVHSGIVDDRILELEESGAIDRSQPIVTGTAIGSQALYDELDRNGRFLFKTVTYTHGADTIRSHQRFMAINSVLQADLFGQVSAEGNMGKLIASPGGLPDFARGALESPGGKSIIAVRARSASGVSPGIVPMLDRPHTATSGAVDADIIVTEYGAAHVRNLSMDARAEAMIGIADPADRDQLWEHWREIRSNMFKIGG